MSLLDALHSLATLPRDISLTALSKACDPAFELKRLDAAVTLMKDRAAAIRPPDPARIERLIVRFKNADQNLDGFEPGEVRLLAWNNEMLLNERFRSQLAERVRCGVVKPNLLVLSQVYFGNWGEHAEHEMFEQMLRILAQQQGGFTPLLQLYKEKANSIFSSTADVFLSRLVASEGGSLPELLERWGVATTSPLASAVSTAYIKQELSDIANGRVGRLDYLLATLQLPLVKLASFQLAIATLILSPHTDRSDSFRKGVEAFVLDHPRLGDPRLPQNVPRWTGIDPAAQRKFRTWRATKDLVFFFKSVLPDGKDPHGRKDFWLRYVDQVVDSVVALCPTDLQRLRTSLSLEQVHHCRIQENQAISCFLMRFKGAKEDFIVAEFSNVGKARIFYYGRFLERIGDINRSEFRLRELKSDEGLAISFSHVSGWQSKVRSTLAQIGIRAS
jgi:hypothetical protein